MENKKRFAETVRQRREELKRQRGSLYSQRGFSGLIGVSHAYLGQIERGETSPSPDFVTRLARHLEIPADDLHAILGQVAGDIGEILKRRPILADLVRELADVPDEVIREKLLAVRQGDW